MASKGIALVTGTSTGIGVRTSIQLAQAGFTVIATMRDVSRSQQLRDAAQEAHVELEILSLDVQSDESVAACVAAVLAKHQRIDVLINNAGAGFLGTLEQTPLEDAKRVFDINFWGVWRMIQAVLPGMREARSGRIVTVSSVGGLVGQPFNDAYCAAKFAVEGLIESMAHVVQETFNVRLSLIEPGPVLTEFVANVEATLPSNQGPQDYAAPLNAYREAVNARFATIAQSADEVAQVIVKAATDPESQLRYPTSPAAQARIATKYVDPTGDSLLASVQKRRAAAAVTTTTTEAEQSK